MSKVYKGRQKLNFEQAGQYYSHAYKIGVEHGRFDERSRLVQLIDDYQHKPDFTIQNLKALIKEQK